MATQMKVKSRKSIAHHLFAADPDGKHFDQEDDLQHRIAAKAYELYEQRGREPGREAEDWLEAERIVKAENERGERKCV